MPTSSSSSVDLFHSSDSNHQNCSCCHLREKNFNKNNKIQNVSPKVMMINIEDLKLETKRALMSTYSLCDDHFFEGAEKRLSLKFSGNSDHRASPSLRTISFQTWKHVLNIVKCRILSITRGQHFDAYLLSESSMFVHQDHIMIKTCGATTLLHCLTMMIQIAFEQGGFNHVDHVNYCHKELLLPEAQHYPHQSFTDERSYLDEVNKKNYNELIYSLFILYYS